VLPVGGVTAKVEAAIEAGMKKVIVPYANKDDVYLGKDIRKRIRIVAVKSFAEVLNYAIKKSKRRDDIIRELKRYEGT